MTTAQQIRAALKQAGYNSRAISVRERPCTYDTSVSVTIKTLDIDRRQIEEICNGFESIDRDERTYEILAGGNTFVDVDYADGLQAPEEYQREAEKIQEEIAKCLSEGREYGIQIAQNGDYTLTAWPADDRITIYHPKKYVRDVHYLRGANLANILYVFAKHEALY